MWFFSSQKRPLQHIKPPIGLTNVEDTWTTYYEQEGVIEDTVKTIVIQNVDEDFSNSTNEIEDNT